MRCFTVLDQTNVVANLAFQRYIGHQSVPSFGIQAWPIASVGIPVGVTVFDSPPRANMTCYIYPREISEQ